MEKYGEGRLLSAKNTSDWNTLYWISSVIRYSGDQDVSDLVENSEKNPKIRAFQKQCGEYALSLSERVNEQMNHFWIGEPLYIAPTEIARIVEISLQNE